MNEQYEFARSLVSSVLDGENRPGLATVVRRRAELALTQRLGSREISIERLELGLVSDVARALSNELNDRFMKDGGDGDRVLASGFVDELQSMIVDLDAVDSERGFDCWSRLASTWSLLAEPAKAVLALNAAADCLERQKFCDFDEMLDRYGAWRTELALFQSNLVRFPSPTLADQLCNLAGAHIKYRWHELGLFWKVAELEAELDALALSHVRFRCGLSRRERVSAITCMVCVCFRVVVGARRISEGALHDMDATTLVLLIRKVKLHIETRLFNDDAADALGSSRIALSAKLRLFDLGLLPEMEPDPVNTSRILNVLNEAKELLDAGQLSEFDYYDLEVWRYENLHDEAP